LEEHVLVHVLRLLGHAGSDKLFRGGNSISGRSASLGESLRDEVSSSRIHIVDGHELLVEDNLLRHVGSSYSTNAPNVLKNDKAERNVFPEKARVFVEDDIEGSLASLGTIGKGTLEYPRLVLKMRLSEEVSVTCPSYIAQILSLIGNT